MRSFVSARFEAKIKERFTNVEVQNFIIRHPKKYLCIDNLAKELTKIENTLVRVSINHLHEVIDSFTYMFAKAAILSKEQELMSKTEQIRQEKEYTAKEELLDTLEKADNELQASVDKLDS